MTFRIFSRKLCELQFFQHGIYAVITNKWIVSKHAVININNNHLSMSYIYGVQCLLPDGNQMLLWYQIFPSNMCIDYAIIWVCNMILWGSHNVPMPLNKWKVMECYLILYYFLKPLPQYQIKYIVSYFWRWKLNPCNSQ